MLSHQRCETAVKAALLLYVVVAFYTQHDMGFANNGDFERVMSAATTGPANLPERVRSDWKPYSRYYIPYWKMGPTFTMPKTSAVLFWAPGIAANYAFISKTTLCASSLGLLPKLLLFASLWLLLRWIDGNFTQRKLTFLLLLGVPYALVITSSDYVAYLNTFYQETASFVCATLFFAAILWLIERPRHWLPLGACFVSLFLLTVAKTSTIYWTFLGVPLVLAVRCAAAQQGRFLKHYATWGLAASVLATWLAFSVTHNAAISPINAYDSLFVGALPFSKDTSAALGSIGLENAEPCVGFSAFQEPGKTYFAAHRNQMSFGNTIRVILREPMIAPRMLFHAANSMHLTSNPYLGRFAYGDPRSSECSRLGEPYDPPLYRTWVLPNIWPLAKYQIGPRGIGLLVFTLAAAGACWLGIRRRGPARSLAIVGLTALLACWIDMTVGILGDGITELPKHMFLANLMFDFALIASVGTAVALCLHTKQLETQQSSSSLTGSGLGSGDSTQLLTSE